MKTIIFIIFVLIFGGYVVVSSLDSSIKTATNLKQPQMETFKDIPGYEGHYQVSDLGRVKSLIRPVWMELNNKFKIINERILKNQTDIDGYLKVSLSKNAKTKQIKVHVLEMMAFKGYKPDRTTKTVIDHIDHDHTNNKLSNLQEITHRLNTSKDRIGKSGYTGVSNRGGRFVARIVINGKRIHLGAFDTAKYASEVYLKSLDEYLLGIKIKDRRHKPKYITIAKKRIKKYRVVVKGKKLGYFYTMKDAENTRDNYLRTNVL